MPSPTRGRRARWSPIPTSERELFAELLRLDRERGWIALLAPPLERMGIAALFGLDAELAAVGGRAREPMAGLVRFQWWREALERAGSGGPWPHPFLAWLGPAMAAGRVPREELLELVDAREEAFECPGVRDMQRAITLADRTGARVHAYAMTMLGGDGEWIERARLAGRALALVRMAAASAASARALAEAARADLEAIPPARPPRQLLAPMLALRLVRLHLRRLERAGYDPARLAGLPPAFALPGLLFARLAGRP